LYNKSTDNAGDALLKIATNIEIMQAQFGSFFSIVAFALEKVTTALVTITTAIPGPIRALIGVGIAFTGVLLILGVGLVGVIGAMAVMRGATKLLQNSELNLTVTTGNLAKVWQELWVEIRKITIDNYSLAKSFDTVNLSTKTITGNVLVGTDAISKWQAALNIVSIGIMGYSIASMALQERMYSEFELVNLLTASYMALQIARTVPGPAGIALGIGAAVGYEALMYDKLENFKRQDRVNRMNMNAQVPTTTNKNYNINIANANLSSDGEGFEDLANRLGDY
jgi:hypothetical protein